MKRIYLVGAIITGLGAFYAAGLMAHGASDSAEGSVKMEYFKNAQKMKIKSMGVEGTHAFLEDIVASDDAKAPIACGLFRMEKGNALTYTYDYDEAKIIIEGSMYVSDGASKVNAKVGDVLFFPKGSTITFTSDNYGVGFICGQRERDGA
jgi:ethanolamine utilization protein EutQ (cupin superfamily)